jgi:hypothetical protein
MGQTEGVTRSVPYNSFLNGCQFGEEREDKAKENINKQGWTHNWMRENFLVSARFNAFAATHTCH